MEDQKELKPRKARRQKSKLPAMNTLFAPYLASHPNSRIFEFPTAHGNECGILDPWEDESVAFLIPDDPQPLANALNKLYLPPRFTALYHKDKRVLEVIWTAFRLTSDQAAINGRAFDFVSDGKKYKCEFKKSSDRLLEISKSAVLMQMSKTEFRNLRSFYSYTSDDRSDLAPDALGEPISFFVSNISWKEDEVINLITKINFYLKYYDFSSPVIVIHDDADPMKVNPRTRFLFDNFPDRINSSDLNPSLITLWAAAFGAMTETEKFLNFFRIIEYVSHFHVDNEVRSQIKREISQPHVMARLDIAADNLIGIVQEYKGFHSSERVTAVISTAVDAKTIWREVCVNPDYFIQDTSFDGGLQIKRIANTATNVDDVPAQFVDNFAKALISIRNSLAHGKDQRTGKSILPTKHNATLLRPWVHLISAAAGQVIIYESIN